MPRFVPDIAQEPEVRVVSQRPVIFFERPPRSSKIPSLTLPYPSMSVTFEPCPRFARPSKEAPQSKSFSFPGSYSFCADPVRLREAPLNGMLPY